ICAWQPFTEWQAKPLMAETLRERWPQMQVAHAPTFGEMLPELPDADIFVGAVIRPDHVKQAPKLKWIHSTSAGIGQLTLPEIKDAGIMVTNASGVFSVPMAEHTIGLILALARNFPDTTRQQDQKTWSQQFLWDKPQHLTEINGTTLVIVGFGSIGREVAKRAAALDMKVIGVNRSGQGQLAGAQQIVSMERLNEVLPEADFVVLCAPETAETKNLFDLKRFIQMKRGARLINLGRGSILDEAALVRSLESGHLGGAALDVANVEPLPPESPLWTAPNLLITPHTSAISSRLWLRQTELLVKLLERWFDGRELCNVADLTKGY
ncbi:MAG TPA: D-2-hydroxyacid dehydrogenase, partial [Candidatus Dormibacteraeota bacterium]|nr:D-2-hydroxyacid dehydrogenase [Candidatus Dormibacteraeota bacterium]